MPDPALEAVLLSCRTGRARGHRRASSRVQSTSTLGPGPAWPEALPLLTREDGGSPWWPLSSLTHPPGLLQEQGGALGPCSQPLLPVTSEAWSPMPCSP